MDVEALIPLLRENPKRGHQLASELAQIDRFAPEPDGARVTVRQSQERIDQIRQARPASPMPRMTASGVRSSCDTARRSR
jgi:hypothetical protein